MPINVNDLYVRISSLALKSQAGYQTSIQFNSDLQGANILLYEYYYKIYSETERIENALLPFIVESNLPLTQAQFSGITDFPADFFHRLEIGVLKTTNNPQNNCNGGGCKKAGCTSCNPVASNKPPTVYPPIMQLYPCDFLLDNEEKYVLSSPIRKPSVSKSIYRHSYKNNKIHVYPRETNSIYLKYLRKAVTPFWNSTLVSTPNGDAEVYSQSGSVQSEFPEQEFENMTDILLLMLGIEIRENALINFVKSKQQENIVR